MVKKKVDSRIRTLLENGIKTGHRSLFLIVGDHGRDQVVNLHYMLSKASIKTRPSVLWCYKKELGFTSHRQKRMRKIKRELARGIRTADEAENPFELFVGSTDIRYCYYKETHKILGQTFGMCVLQDFPSLTPNLLARTMETVEGGGAIVILLKSMSSLKQLYTMSMDVHSRFRTESHQDVVGRFNERFLLSLANSENTIVVDDELNILPLSTHIRTITKYQPELDEAGEVKKDPMQVELTNLKESMKDTPPVGNLIECTRTFDQAKAVLTFMESVSDKSLRSTVVLTAGRGRGKSAALGLSVAGAVAFGYSNIFVTAPSPENLKTLFEMIFKGFDAFGYKEHQDYEVIQSTNPDFNKAIVRVNIFHSHRQTIQYIQPSDYAKLGQAELLVIDEAAAIPLPLVKNLLGPYLVFMSSTINGYEGTGRSLSLKLVKQLRVQSQAAANATSTSTAAAAVAASSATSRTLREVTLDEPIRYTRNDPIESWLNNLLCLNCTANVPKLTPGSALPHPNSCELYYVERDTLFSSHKASESFLQKMMSLYVSSHYKNSPNDLQLMSDAPAHHLFVLLGPVTSMNSMPDILAVIQVCLEGSISRESVLKSLAKGERASGDLIPWCLSQQYQNQEFASLSGARIVRIATHPELGRMGYASRAMELLSAYYEGKITNLSESATPAKPHQPANIVKTKSSKKVSMNSGDEDEDGDAEMKDAEEDESNDDEDEQEEGKREPSALLSEILTPRKSLPPLLTSLQDRQPEPLHYIGVSYGLTQELYNFWTKTKFTPLYLRLTPNDLTGEHTCIMLRNLHDSSNSALETLTHAHWLDAFHTDFLNRFQKLLGYNFKKFDTSLALSVIIDEKNSVLEKGLESATTTAAANSSSSTSQVSPWIQSSSAPITFTELQTYLTSFDLRRLESYSNSLVDYHMILDLLPIIAGLFFRHRLEPVRMSYTQAAIVLGLGLQHKDVADLEHELGLPSQQILAQFNKSVRKIVARLKEIEVQAVKDEVEKEQDSAGIKKSSSTSTSAAIPASSKKAKNQPLAQSLNAELDASGNEALNEMKRKQRELFDGMNLEQYAIGADDGDFESSVNGNIKVGSTISLPSSDKKKEQHREYLKTKTDGSQKKHKLGGAMSSQGSAKKKKI